MICMKYQGAEMTIDLMGAEMRSFTTADGRDWLWRGSPDAWKSSAPVLFPAIGALKNGGATIAGEFYAVPRHGFAKFQAFRVLEQSEKEITFLLEQNEETKKVYPFDFGLTVTYRFLKDGFEARFCVENRSDREMPFLIGGHPGFNCPMNPGETFEDYVLYFEKEETVETSLCNNPAHNLDGTEPIPFEADRRTLPLNHADFDRLDTYVMCGLNSRSVDLIHRETRRGLRFHFDMPVLAIWTMPEKNAPYVCIEPWQGSPAFANETGRFEDKPWCVRLNAGESFQCGYRMEILD